MNLAVSVYQRRSAQTLTWTTLGLGPHTMVEQGHAQSSVQNELIKGMKKLVASLAPSEMRWFQFTQGIELRRVRLELSLRGARKRKLSGLFPIIVVPRWISATKRVEIAYHPERQDEWLVVEADESLETQLTRLFQKTWSELDEDALSSLLSNGKEQLSILEISASPVSLLDKLPPRRRGVWDDLKTDPAKMGAAGGKKRGQRVLHSLGTNLSQRAADDRLPAGLPRPVYRERLTQLLCGERKQSTLVVGPSGCGKTTLIRQWIRDLLDAEDFGSHRNFDRVSNVWQLSGKRIIAGMSYVGDWEQRCMQILEEARKGRNLLFVDDVFLFGQLGRSRESDRNFAEFFHASVSRGECVIVGECTDEQLRRFEDNAPSFAGLFARVHVQPTTTRDTLRMLLHETRALRDSHSITVEASALRTLLEMGSSLFPGHALPGNSIELLRQCGRQHTDSKALSSRDVMTFLSEKTGLRSDMLTLDAALSPEQLRSQLTWQVIGQPEAIEAATDLIVRIRTGLVDARRPYGVYLFTGPTGTGKTELAKSVAEYLFGSTKRLVRLDMGEFATPDAAARLIGDRWTPEGVLTSQVQAQPFCVVLFDEIEKADPSVLNLLLQLFDEGRLTDAAGNLVSFAHTVIIMTSNLGARRSAPLGFGDSSESLQHDVMQAVKAFFPPELFNRIDRIVPFKPLSQEVSLAVVKKEISLLGARRGLLDRNIFVYVSDGVAARIAREAFAQEDGARALKRYIDSRIGTLLAEHIVTGKQAAMRVMHIFDVHGEFVVNVEALSETEPLDIDWPMLKLMQQPVTQLKAMLPEIAAFVEELEQSEQLAQLSETIGHYLREHNLGRTQHAEQLYHLEASRASLQTFRERVAGLLHSSEKSHEDAEVEHFGYYGEFLIPLDDVRGHVVRYKVFDRRAVQPGKVPVKAEILDCIAEAAFLRTSLTKAHEVEQHAVFIELMMTGDVSRRAQSRGQGEGLLRWLAMAYATARGELEDVAAYKLREGALKLKAEAPLDRLEEALRGGSHVVLKLVGLCVLDFFALETGSHVWQSMADAPEIVRVRVVPARAGRSAQSLIDEHLAEQQAFEQAVRSGASSPPPNPSRLLPAVRKFRFEAPKNAGHSVPVEVEDYILSHSATLFARNIDEVLRMLWSLRMTGLSGTAG